MGFDSKRKAEVFITGEGASPHESKFMDAPAEPAPKPRVDFSSYIPECMRALPIDYVFGELDVMDHPKILSGEWNRGGHYDSKQDAWVSPGGSVVTFQELRDAVDARIRELNLSAELVHAYPHSVQSIEEGRAFRRLSFDERMKTLRRGESKQVPKAQRT